MPLIDTGGHRSWTADELRRIDATGELHIAVRRRDGGVGRYLPIWAVTVDRGVYVRTWSRRATGWYGRAVATGWARIRVPGVEADVAVADLADHDGGLRAAIDRAYRLKYAPDGSPSVDRMIGDEAAMTTLSLSPSRF